MNIFRKFFSLFRGSKKQTRAAIPSLTILMAVNPNVTDVSKARKHLDEEAKKLAFLNPKTALITTIADHNDYSKFCIECIADHFDTDFVLVIQMDSKVMKPEAWDNGFFGYDYIGAPWDLEYSNKRNWRHGWLRKHHKDSKNKDFWVGNGGFSLRSKKLCQWLKNNAKYCDVHEDNYISILLRSDIEAAGMKFAPYEVAKRFAVEKANYEGQFGVHKWVNIDGVKAQVNK